MNMIPQTVTLRSERHFGSKAPSEETGEIIRRLQPATRQAIRMAFEGRSEARGTRPRWLVAASDIRFAGVSGDDDTILHFEIPQLGEAAEQVYAQQQLWPALPDPLVTGLDLLAVVADDIRSGRQDSVRFDRHLLQTLMKFGRSLDGTFSEMWIMGRLDMVRSSTQSFAMKLDSGEEVRGVLLRGDVTDLAPLFRQEVLVLGEAVFRPSGQVLRIDADQVLPASGQHRLFAKMPKPRARHQYARARQAKGAMQGGLKGIIGKWPGDESDQEIRRILQEIS